MLTRQPALHIMFGMLWAMLLVQITLSNNEVYAILTAHFARASEQSGINNKIISDYSNYIDRYGRQYGDYYTDFMQPTLMRMKWLHRRCDEAITYLDTLASQIAQASGGYIDSFHKLKMPESRSWQARVFKHQQDILDLVSAIDTLNEDMIRCTRADPDIRYELRNALPSRWCGDARWDEQAPCREHFAAIMRNTQSAAAIAALAALRQNILLSEEMILNHLVFREGTGRSDSYTMITALALPGTSYALPGEKVSATIFLASPVKNTSSMHGRSNSGVLRNIDGRIFEWTGRAKGPGRQHVSGTITIPRGTGDTTLRWSFNYQSSWPYAQLQLRGANRIFRGAPNLVSVSYGKGDSSEALTLAAPGASVIATGPNTFEILIKNRRLKELNVFIIRLRNHSADTIGGSIMKIEDLPLPLIRLAGAEGGSVSRAGILQSGRLSVYARDEDPALQFSLLRYKISIISRDSTEASRYISVSGPDFPGHAEVRDLIREAKKGDRIFFSDLRVQLPDGTVVAPAEVNYRLD